MLILTQRPGKIIDITLEDGRRITVSEAARRIGISHVGLWSRLKRGVPRRELLSPGYGPRDVKQIVAEHKSSFMAAVNGAITADEYLKENET